MGNLKNSIHLLSARKWLMRAEEAFDNEHDIRGELDLLLAQAELQHVREAKNLRWWHRYRLILNCVAFALALFVAVLGVGGVHFFIYYSNSYDSKPAEKTTVNISSRGILRDSSSQGNSTRRITGTENQSTPRDILQNASSNTIAETSEVTKLPVQAAAEASAQKAVSKENIASAEKTVTKPTAIDTVIPALSQSEIQKLVRVAGESLRGSQTIGKSEGGNE